MIMAILGQAQPLQTSEGAEASFEKRCLQPRSNIYLLPLKTTHTVDFYIDIMNIRLDVG